MQTHGFPSRPPPDRLPCATAAWQLLQSNQQAHQPQRQYIATPAVFGAMLGAAGTAPAVRSS